MLNQAEMIPRASALFQKRYFSRMEACYYTGRTWEQLKRATAQGHLRVVLSSDGGEGYKLEDLDAYMTGGGVRAKKKKNGAEGGT